MRALACSNNCELPTKHFETTAWNAGADVVAERMTRPACVGSFVQLSPTKRKRECP